MLLVVAVALVRDGRVLMQQRDFSAQHGGLWEFPGGKLEPGETPEEAAVRELEEELGVQVATDALVPVGFASGRTAALAAHGDKPPRPLLIVLYMCSDWEGEPEALEAAGVDWCAVDEVAGLDMPPLDYPLARALCRHLE